MEEQKQNLGSDVDPETGNFIQKEKEKQIYLSFRPFEENWMEKSENKAVSDLIREEYDQSPTELKFLTGVCDGTVLGAYERLFVESKLGQNFYKLRPLHESGLSAKSVFDQSREESVFDIDKHFNGYHFRGNQSRATEILRDLRGNIDITQMIDINNEEAVYAKIENDPSFNEVFTREDIATVEQFATSLVVFIKDESWDKYNQKQEELYGNGRAGAFFSIGGSLIYAPQGMKEEPEYMIPALKHEYQHLIDYSMQKNLFKDGEWHIETSDRDLLNLKSEISAYLEYLEVEGTDPYDLLPEIQSYLRNYPRLYGLDENAKKSDRFFELIKKTKPFIKGLVKEAGFSEDDPKNIGLFLKTFLSALPERPIIFRILEKIPETGLYKAGI